MYSFPLSKHVRWYQQEDMPLAVQSQPTTAANFTPSQGTKALEDYGPLIYDRYTSVFEPVDPASIPRTACASAPTTYCSS